MQSSHDSTKSHTSTSELEQPYEPQEPSSSIDYSEPPSSALLPPPDFKPFFTIIHDSNSTQQHHHPTVHYIFADDEPDLVTDAALRSLEASSTSSSSGVEERVVLIDLAEDGKTVVSTSSMSPNWQAVTATIGAAPSWGGAGSSHQAALMLSITGREHRESATTPKGENLDPEELANKHFTARLIELSEALGGEGHGGTEKND